MNLANDKDTSWTSVLKRARSALDHSGDIDVVVEFKESVEAWHDQISAYNLFLLNRGEKKALSDSEKAMLVETRAALRFALACFSFRDDDIRARFQILVCEKYEWHAAISLLLAQDRGDSKCRMFAARLFSNLVAGNETSSLCVAESTRLSLSEKEILNKMSNLLSETNGDSGSLEPCWANMLISSSREKSRDSLAGIAAALFNCIVSLSIEQRLSFARRIASDQLVVSTLLRQFVSADVVKASIGRKESCRQHDSWDSATDWIILIFVQLFSHGLLPTAFNAIGNTQQKDLGQDMILPEQNVLLHCAATAAQSSIDEPPRGCDGKKNPFGGLVGWEATKASYDFLVELFVRFRIIETSEDRANLELVQSAALSSLDIISISLAVDSDDVSHTLRKYLGTKTELLAHSARLLGRLVDELTHRISGIKARDLQLTNSEQQWLVSLVRLVANIIYRCRESQDQIRTILVPVQSAANAEKGDTIEDVLPRTMLHVLLTCTSFATSCFTLREWGVIAIRNVLEDNEENQRTVAALDAQSPVQSAALDQAGVKVQLDKNGKFTLSTIEEDK